MYLSKWGFVAGPYLKFLHGGSELWGGRAQDSNKLNKP